MSLSRFFSNSGRSSVRKAVEAVEAQTSAEIVVAIRKQATTYRATDYLTGIGMAMATLAVLLYHPTEFPLEPMLPEVVIAFVLGSLLSAHVWGWKRLVTPKSEFRKAVGAAARAAFVDLGVSRTTGRTGIMVFVCLLEARVEVVTDIGVQAKATDDEFRKAVKRLENALGANANLDTFLESLRALGPALAPSLPRADGDVNELPDEPVMA